MAHAVSAGSADAAASNRLPVLMLGSLGVVYGDIGTSPLYTLRECFGHDRLPLNEAAIVGVLSLVFWSLILVVTIKYVIFVMRADNKGEGGILALAALVLQTRRLRNRRRIGLVLAIIGAALFYGDCLITPAISVLSAVEGVRVTLPVLDDYIVPIATVVLVGLFLVQRRGTAGVGRLFGPIMFTWFSVLALLGVAEIVTQPGVLKALNPLYGFHLFAVNGWIAFVALGSVVLAVTGAEALYADMGHFGRRPIRLAWLYFVLPALLLNYFGQGALLINNPAAVENPFYLLAPSWARIPLIILATLATVTASQAVISGAFSLTRQAIQLGYLPRLEIRHTAASEIGQVYVPAVNWLLMVIIVAIVIGFGSSSNLAGSYGIAVTGAMAIDSVLAFFVAVAIWRWRVSVAVPLFLVFLTIELTFLSANLLKIPAGGWFPLVIATAVFMLMTTWRQGRQALFRRLYHGAQPMKTFIATCMQRMPPRIAGTAIFMTGNTDTVPRSLLHNLKHNKVLHERVIVLKVETVESPTVSSEDRVTVEHLADNFYKIIVRYGFIEQPDIPLALRQCKLHGLSFNLMDTSFFLSRETIIPSVRPDLTPWREQMFIALSHMALSATEFFRLPPDRVVELGSQVEM